MRVDEELFFANELLADLLLMRDQVEEQLGRCYKRCVELNSAAKIAESLEEVVMR